MRNQKRCRQGICSLAFIFYAWVETSGTIRESEPIGI